LRTAFLVYTTKIGKRPNALKQIITEADKVKGEVQTLSRQVLLLILLTGWFI
jgi:hypothetical protein